MYNLQTQTMTTETLLETTRPSTYAVNNRQHVRLVYMRNKHLTTRSTYKNHWQRFRTSFRYQHNRPHVRLTTVNVCGSLSSYYSNIVHNSSSFVWVCRRAWWPDLIHLMFFHKPCGGCTWHKCNVWRTGLGTFSKTTFMSLPILVLIFFSMEMSVNFRNG